MKIGQDIFRNVVRRSIDSMSLRRELLTARHFIAGGGRQIKVGLAVGFASAGINRIFAQLGGYWVSAEFTREVRELIASVLGDDQVVTLGKGGQIPFESKQFDTVVVSGACIFYRGVTLAELVQECHRVLDNGGLLVLTLPRRKLIGLARCFGGARGRIEREMCCSEKDVFELLRHGFDVLGFKGQSHFFVQLATEKLEKRGLAGDAALPGWVVRLIYGCAALLDLPLVITRNYNIVVCARRKGWRGRKGGLVNDHTAVVSNALFFEHKKMRNTFSLTRFKNQD